MLALWNDPPAWFAAHNLTPPAAFSGASRTQTVEAGLPEMAGKQDFYLRIANELHSDGMLIATLMGMVSANALMGKLTSDFARKLVKFITESEGSA